MTVLKCLAAATLLVSVSACAPSNQAYAPSGYAYSTGQPAYAYSNGQPAYYTTSQPTYYNASPTYSPNAAYTPQYSNETPAARYGYNSQGDYYRNYGGTYHPGPERNCPGC
jgi:hypothetical protein